MNSLYNYPHRRFNQLTGEWVLVSPHRTLRPWQGKVEGDNFSNNRPMYDPNCYLCPGNSRAGGHKNPKYADTFYFTNDFSALLPDGQSSNKESNGLLKTRAVNGTCEVICFSPRHDLSLSQMEIKNIVKVIDLWVYRYNELSKKYKWVQIFENKGEIMGCSNPHPHGQIWALNAIPSEPAKENNYQSIYYQQNHSVLLLDYLNLELQSKERIVIDDKHWVVLIPFWATWPYEALLLPKRHILKITDITKIEKENLAAVLKQFLNIYDKLFQTPFPYSMGWHGAPFNGEDNIHWQLHAHFYPPLLRSARIKKFMVGYEMLAEAQRDITPEQAAEALRLLKEN